VWCGVVWCGVVETLIRLLGHTPAVAYVGGCLQTVTIESQREEVSQAIMDLTDWLYDEGEDAELAEYLERHRQLEELVEPIFHRLEEAEAREELVKSTFESLDSLDGIMAQWAKEKPQVRHVPCTHAHTRTVHPATGTPYTAPHRAISLFHLPSPTPPRQPCIQFCLASAERPAVTRFRVAAWCTFCGLGIVIGSITPFQSFIRNTSRFDVRGGRPYRLLPSLSSVVWALGAHDL